MRYLDVCAGISASTVAWKPLGWEAAAYSEIEAAPRAVLAHHYPDTPLHGDFTTIRGDEYGPIDLLVGGTPCQDFSVAGLRAGLDGDRGNLSLEFLRLADRTRPRWVVWENVPGVLSIDGGRAFGAILGGLGELGYGFAYRVLDAQHFGVPQRRRRVFVVGCAGDWRRAGAVLSERHSLSGHPAPRRESRPPAAGSIAPSAQPGGLTPYSIMPMNSSRDYVARPVDVARPIMAAGPVSGNQGGDFVAYQTSGNCGAWETGQVTGALDTGTDPNSTVIAFAQNTRDEVRIFGGDGQTVGALAAQPGMKQQSYVAFDMRGREGGAQFEGPHDTANIRAAAGGSSRSYVASSSVRRLTPRECERLQGFPDDYTLVPHRGKPMADGPRYKALGNSMAVPVMRWIGERIAQVDALASERLAA